jgi:hypothetical protein
MQNHPANWPFSVGILCKTAEFGKPVRVAILETDDDSMLYGKYVLKLHGPRQDEWVEEFPSASLGDSFELQNDGTLPKEVVSDLEQQIEWWSEEGASAYRSE